MSLQRIFANAGAQSTVASPITAVQTTVTLASASGFPVPASTQQLAVVILDSGNGAFDRNNPLATNYEYQPVTGISGNVLTFGGGVRASFAGTTPKAYLAGATVAATWLSDDLAAAFPIKLGDTAAVSYPANGISFAGIPQGFRHLRLEGTARVDAAPAVNDLYVQFNADNAANYAWSQVYGDGGSSGNAQYGTVSAATAFPLTARVTGAGMAASFTGDFCMEIKNYTSTSQYKTYLATSWYFGGASGILFRAGYWNNAGAPITSIFLGPPGATHFVAPTFICLYGIP